MNSISATRSKRAFTLNVLMSGKNENKVNNTASTVLASEASRTSALQALSSASACLRHFDGSNYAFVEGHVKWIKGVVSATDATGNVPTFFVPLTAAEEANSAGAQTAAAAKFPLSGGGEIQLLYAKAYASSTDSFGSAVSSLSIDTNNPTDMRRTCQ